MLEWQDYGPEQLSDIGLRPRFFIGSRLLADGKEVAHITRVLGDMPRARDEIERDKPFYEAKHA